jgi:hypothetical protein
MKPLLLCYVALACLCPAVAALYTNIHFSLYIRIHMYTYHHVYNKQVHILHGLFATAAPFFENTAAIHVR